MRTKGFEGWYFKHQKGNDSIAFIPGRANTGAFVQVISTSGSKQFDVPSLSIDSDLIKAGSCLFSKHGCKLELPGISGRIIYENITPLKSDIMGVFKYFPMQCRHGVISMKHSLSGSINIDGKLYDFDGGNGYIEKDSGTSFPRSYLWLQCNDFTEDCSIMVSIADIPFCGTNFTGCICAIIYKGEEYRLATYCGVRICEVSAEHVRLSQRNLLLDIEIKPTHGGYALLSPVQGKMSGKIRESSNADIHVRLWKKGQLVIDLRSAHAMYEFVPEHNQTN